MKSSIEAFIDFPARSNIPATKIFTKQYIENNLGDRDTIILLPGGPGNDMAMYDDPTQSIAQTFFQMVDVILFDPRSCGKSEICDVTYCTLDHYINDVEAIRQYFNLSADRFLVFGQSYGAIVALGYATRYANALKKLLLIGGVVNASFYQEAKADLAKIGTNEQIAFAEKLWHGTFDGSKQEISDFYRLMSPLYMCSFEPAEPPLEIGYNLDVMNYGWGNFLKCFDYQAALSDVCCDVLLLWGENEWIMPRSHIDIIANAIPRCTLKTYPECMHMLWMDQWERFVNDALAFLR